MRIGDHPSPQRGFAYLLLLVLVAVIGIAGAAAVELGAGMARRDAEQQLLHVGAEFQRALHGYAGLPPEGLPATTGRGPRTLEELLKDPRAAGTRRHLRKIHHDPLTGRAEWGIVRDSEGFIVGIHSLAPGRPLQRTGWPPRWAHFEEQESYAGWVFGFSGTLAAQRRPQDASRRDSPAAPS